MSSAKHASFGNTAFKSVAGASPASTDAHTKPTALAKLHLEDGTTFTGYSFGAHQAVEGEVSSRVD